MSKEIAEEYASSLADLTVNSKPLINMLTILAEEYIDHAGVIVETVEKHLEKVHPDIKLPVLYLIDSIIKNVGGAYTQKFSQSIVNMFTRTFKQVDEKVRSQMFKLRETWHDVFPSTKLYQLDVKVNLIDPAWPIQAQPQQSNIHVNPNFLKKNTPTTSPVHVSEEEERMRNILAKKEQELLMLQRKKVEMELEQTKRQLEMAERNVLKAPAVKPPSVPTMPVALVNPVMATPVEPIPVNLPVKQRLGPPVGGGGPASAAPAGPAPRRDPRLARAAPRLLPPHPPHTPHPPLQPLPPPQAASLHSAPDPKLISRLPPIPKIRRDIQQQKKKKDNREDRKKKREENNIVTPSPEKKARKEKNNTKVRKDREGKKRLERKPQPPVPEPVPTPEIVAFKELKNYNKERYMRRNKQKSESPEHLLKPEENHSTEPDAPNVPNVIVENKDVDLRILQPVVPEIKTAPITHKRLSTELVEGKAKKSKLDKFDLLFGNEDVDLRQLPLLDEPLAPLPPFLVDPVSNNKVVEEDVAITRKSSPKQKKWNKVREKPKKKIPSQLDLVRAKLAEATKGQDRLGRPSLNKLPNLEIERRPTLGNANTDLNGDSAERITPAVYRYDTASDSQNYVAKDSDMRMNPMPILDSVDAPKPGLLPLPPAMPMFGPFPPNWRGPMPRIDDFGPGRFRGPVPPFFRGTFDPMNGPWPLFDPRLPIPALPAPKLGMCQGECPLLPYERITSPPPLGATNVIIPPTDLKVLEYIDQDPFKTIQIDGIPREIRFYGDTAIIIMDWDDPREIKFLPGSRRVTFDNKDSIVLSFNEGYKQVEIDDQTFDIKFGAPTRELFINGRWYECHFGGQPFGVMIDGKPRLVHLEGPLPQVDIGKSKRTDLVAGKIDLIVDAVHTCPVYLDAKVQKVQVNGKFFTLRFVDSLKTVLINEQPFKVEFGDLPKPIVIGQDKYFIRFSALPRYVKPGLVRIANMEGTPLLLPTEPVVSFENIHDQNSAETGVEIKRRPAKTPSPDVKEDKGLDLFASLMPSSSMAPASTTAYSSADAMFAVPDKIPGLETPAEEKPANPILPILGNINVNDLFAKLVVTGIVQVQNTNSEPEKVEPKPEEKVKPTEDKNTIHKVDLLKPETLRVKQRGLVSRLYGGMQCSGCGARFPPERTARYSQHLDWHFRQNRRERDSARRAHSRRWHYDLPDWLQYEELEDLDEREKSWFEAGGAEGAAGAEDAEGAAPSVAAGAPAHQHCALCGDAFHQFYNEDREEWHLRNSLAHRGRAYHPDCLHHYQESLAKNEPEAEEKKEEIVNTEEKVEESIVEIKDIDDEINPESDSESVELVEPEPVELPEPVEIDEGDEDDVIYKAEPVEQVVVEDDADTDDETCAARLARDHLLAARVKLEPPDPDDEPILTAEEEGITLAADSTRVEVQSAIDGNFQLEMPLQPTATPAIRINISKPTAVVENRINDSLEDVSADEEPLPPGEEPELEYKLKPALETLHLSRQPPVQRGTELSGLCSVM